MTDFVGRARPITANEVGAAANAAKLGLAEVRAVMAVESRNSGFDGRRRPAILFEPHVFYRNLSGKAREAAVRAGLAYRSWGQMKYPMGSDAQYLRLAQAIKINEEAAYRSISMGLGQILGENYKYAGCSSAKEMFEEAKDSEAKQLRHMLNFINARGLGILLMKHDWYSFARSYNGTGQPTKYAKWMEREYEKWARILRKPRNELTAKDLKDAGSKTIASAETAKKAVATAVVTAPAAGAALEAAREIVAPVSDAVNTARQAQDAWGWISENWPFVVGGVLFVVFIIAAFLAWRYLNRIEEERVLNAQTGMNQRI